MTAKPIFRGISELIVLKNDRTLGDVSSRRTLGESRLIGYSCVVWPVYGPGAWPAPRNAAIQLHYYRDLFDFVSSLATSVIGDIIIVFIYAPGTLRYRLLQTYRIPSA